MRSEFGTGISFLLTTCWVVGTAGCGNRIGLGVADPPVPPAQGAVTEVISPTAGGAECDASSGPFAAPPNATQSLNCDLTSPGCKPTANIVVDGKNASVECRVTEVAGGFSLNGTLDQGDVKFSVQGTLAPSGGKAFVSSSHAQHSLQDPGCDVSIALNTGEIKPGAIWAAFNCTSFGDISTGSSGCTAMGKFVFENCDK